MQLNYLLTDQCLDSVGFDVITCHVAYYSWNIKYALITTNPNNREFLDKLTDTNTSLQNTFLMKFIMAACG